MPIVYKGKLPYTIPVSLQPCHGTIACSCGVIVSNCRCVLCILNNHLIIRKNACPACDRTQGGSVDGKPPKIRS